MTVESACIFPQTVVNENFLGHLLQVFPALVYLKPTENVNSPCEKSTPFVSELLSGKRLQFIVPAPLGPLGERFNALLRDIENNRENFVNQLAHMGGDQLTAGKTESLSSIKTNLSRTRTLDRHEEKLTEMLWQARLILKIAEIQEREEAEIRNELQTIYEKQHDLFHELREETENTFITASMQHANLRADTPGFKHRLKAWTRLMCLGENPPSKCRIFVTQSVDAADMLVEKARQEGHLDINASCRIPLPLPVNREKTTLEVIPELHSLWLNAINKKAHAEAGSTPLPLPGGLTAEQDNTTSQAQLFVYPVQGVSPATLFTRAFTPDTPPSDQTNEVEHRWLVALFLPA